MQNVLDRPAQDATIVSLIRGPSSVRALLRIDGRDVLVAVLGEADAATHLRAITAALHGMEPRCAVLDREQVTEIGQTLRSVVADLGLSADGCNVAGLERVARIVAEALPRCAVCALHIGADLPSAPGCRCTRTQECAA